MLELFDGINETNKIRILQLIETNSFVYKKDNIILSSIKNDNIICIIISGHAQIIKNNLNGNRQVIEDLHDNDIFGSISANIFSPEYEIITITDCKIAIIEFNNIISSNYTDSEYNLFLRNLLKIFFNKISDLNNRIEILTNKTIRDKLLTYFKMNVNDNTSRIIYLPFNYSNLADYLAVNRCAMARELKSLKNEGLIDVKGRRIKLLYYL